MKTKIYYWILLFGLIIFAKTALAQNIIIRGTIKDDAPLKALIFEPIVAPTILNSKKEVFPHQGVFEINIPIAQPTEVRIAYKNETFKVFAIPNSTIILDINFPDIKSSLITQSKNNEDHAFLNREIALFFNEDSIKNWATTLNYSDFVSKIELEKAILKQMFEESLYFPYLSETFKNYFNQEYLFSNALLKIIDYPLYTSKHSDSFYLSYQKMIHTFQQMPYKEASIITPNFIKLHQKVLRYQTVQKTSQDSSFQFEQFYFYKNMFELAKRYPIPSIQDVLLEGTLLEYIKWYRRPQDLKNEIYYFTEKLSNPEQKTAIKNKLVQIAQYEKNAINPPMFWQDNQQTPIHSYSFRGQMMYVYFWASWCESCIQEIKALQKWKSEFPEHPLQLFFISIDPQLNLWKKTMQNLNQNIGIHGIAYPGGIESEMAQKYLIQNLPQAFLIDYSGNNIQKAPLPSQRSVFKDFLFQMDIK
jgi:thiol-disulfide isomerase/thioredoxin